METEVIDPRPSVQLLMGAPPLMPWRQFADWIRMGDEPETVWAWIKRGYLPSVRIGRHRMVNVALLNRQLEEKDEV